MKLGVLLSCLICLPFCYGQQDHLYSGNGFTTFEYNPASFGQWNRFSVNLAAATSIASNGIKPSGVLFNVEHRFPFSYKNKLNFGYGINTQMIKYYDIDFDQEQFEIPLNCVISVKNTSLSIGLSPGARRVYFKYDFIPDLGLPSPGTHWNFDMGAGLMWYNDKFYLGFSSTHLFQEFSQNIAFKSARHYYLDGGYRIQVGNNTIYPIASFRSDGSTWTLQTMAYFLLKDDLFSIGAGYTIRNSIDAGIAVKFKGFRLGYNLDYLVNNLSNFNHYYHEMRLSYQLN